MREEIGGGDIYQRGLSEASAGPCAGGGTACITYVSRAADGAVVIVRVRGTRSCIRKTEVDDLVSLHALFAINQAVRFRVFSSCSRYMIDSRTFNESTESSRQKPVESTQRYRASFIDSNCQCLGH